MSRLTVERWARVVAALLVAAVIFAPHVLSQIASLRAIALVAAVLACGVEIVFSDMSRRRKLVVGTGLLLYLGAGMAIIELLAALSGDRLFAVNAEHLFVLLPVYALLGAVVYRTSAGRIYLRVLLSVALAVSAVAIAESVFGLSLVGRDYEFLISQREGITRALVAGENSLTLGVSLAAMVPLTLKIPTPWMRYGTAVVLVAGTWATGSRGPAAIAACVALVQFIPIARTLLQRYTWVVYAAAAAAMVGLAVASVFFWTPYIAGSTGIAYSSNYRGALYSLLPQMLVERPFGYALGTPEAGRWMVDSELHGTFDIVRSIDSEIVFAILGLGWIGLALFLAAVFVAIATLRTDTSLGLSALVLTALGFIIALHGWDGMSMLWYGLLGACLSVTIGPWIRRRMASHRGTAPHSRPDMLGPQ
ncbi:hypothetical protein [Microbacterium oxydans]|uniref:hypothetical protein n=1 Tax=Microbacterium oxydans TaxID=82380 RepID=UPI0037C9308B